MKNYGKLYELCYQFNKLASNDLFTFIEEVKQKDVVIDGLKFSLMPDSVNGKEGEFIWGIYANHKHNIFIIVEIDVPATRIYVYAKGNVPVLKYQPTRVNLSTAIQEAKKLFNEAVTKASKYDDVTVYKDPAELKSELKMDPLGMGTLTKENPAGTVLGLARKLFPNTTPSKIGAFIGHGGEGEVFEYGPDKIIKIMIVHGESNLNSTINILTHIKSKPSNCAAVVYDFGVIGKIGSKDLLGNPDPSRDVFLFYYISERLFPVNWANIDEEQFTDIAGKLQRCLKDTLGINAHDLEENPDNIMQNAKGELKFIDYGPLVSLI